MEEKKKMKKKKRNNISRGHQVFTGHRDLSTRVLNALCMLRKITEQTNFLHWMRIPWLIYDETAYIFWDHPNFKSSSLFALNQLVLAKSHVLISVWKLWIFAILNCSWTMACVNLLINYLWSSLIRFSTLLWQSNKGLEPYRSLWTKFMDWTSLWTAIMVHGN